VTRRDESGTYALQRSDDQSTFSVRPNSGGEQTWTFRNDEQRKMIPEQYREKLRMLEEVSEEMRRDGGPRNPDARPHEGSPRPKAETPPEPRRPAPEAGPGSSPPPSRSRDTF
jgi:hypothetical protein